MLYLQRGEVGCNGQRRSSSGAAATAAAKGAALPMAAAAVASASHALLDVPGVDGDAQVGLEQQVL